MAYDTKYAGDTVQDGTPTPDAQVAIQTATGEQTVTVTGKNLFNKDAIVNGALNGDGTISGSTGFSTSGWIPVMPNTQYHKGDSSSARLKFYYKDKTPISNVYDDISNAGSAKAFTTPANVFWMRLSLRTTTAATLQIELGSVASTYEAFQSQSYTVDLGSIELCEIGTYWDYIYNSNDD